MPVSCCACKTHINNVIFGIYKKNVLMQSSSSRFINPSAFLLATVCDSRHMFAQVCCVHVRI